MGLLPSESPIAASRFGISVDGVQIAQFSELLATAGSSVDFVESGQGVRLLDGLVGKRIPSEVTLRRPRTSDVKLQSWYHTKVRKTCRLTVCSATGAVAAYSLTQCWPKTLEIGFKAGASPQLMETVTIIAERIQRVSP